ncbi:MAG: alpha/beta hydrolase [Caldilineaceae bacterium]|nr:alpha/beta hydrolase [Caldilineaceae bacterium]
MGTGVAVAFAFLFILVGVLALRSSGKPHPIRDENGAPLAGSLSEKIFVEINGVQQGMVIQSRDTQNPVLLFLHGGMPEYFLTEKYPTGLENDFTVVWWEQRGSGLSYSPAIPGDTITAEQLISDTLALTDYLRQRFGQEKIYLMGHSGGSFIGILAVARAPELYHAYIGVAQMSHQLKSEKLAYDYMLAQFKANGNREMVRKLEAAPVTMANGVPAAYLQVRDQAMHMLGVGTTHEMKSIITGILIPSWLSREYTLGEKLNLWRGKAQGGVSILFETMQRTDLSRQVTDFHLPIYFMSGVFDYTCNYTLSKDYFEKINAPVKGFYTFEGAAHSPMFEEPQKLQRILREDVLTGRNQLADRQR